MAKHVAFRDGFGSWRSGLVPRLDEEPRIGHDFLQRWLPAREFLDRGGGLRQGAERATGKAVSPVRLLIEVVD